MGTIWWQLNDSWPVISWALVDAGGRPKPAWHALRNAYAPRLLTIQPRGAALAAFAVNDTAEPWRLDGSVRRLDVDGRVLAEVALDRDVDAWSSEMVGLPASVSTPGSPGRELLLAEAETSRAWWWFVADREFDYRAPTFDVHLEHVDREWHRVTLVADRLVRDLAVFVDRLSPAAEVDRQLVTALPGEPVELQVAGLADLDATAISHPPVCRTANDLVAGRR